MAQLVKNSVVMSGFPMRFSFSSSQPVGLLARDPSKSLQVVEASMFVDEIPIELSLLQILQYLNNDVICFWPRHEDV